MADPFARNQPPDLRIGRGARAGGWLAVVLVHAALLGLPWKLERAPREEPAALPPLQVTLRDPAPRSSAPLAFDIHPRAPRTELVPPVFEVQPDPEPVPELLPDPIPAPPAAASVAPAAAAPATSTRPDARVPACWPYRWLLGVSRSIQSALKYPADARRSGDRGTAFVRVSVDRSGRIVDAPLLRSSGHARLDAEARDVFHRIGRFEPIASGECAGYDVIVVDQPVRFGR